MPDVPNPTQRSRPRRVAASLSAVSLAIALSASVVSANHTFGTLDCGAAGVFEVEGVKPAGPPFDVPTPWSGIFLLEGTTQVFRAFSNSHFEIEMTPLHHSPRPFVTCTLSSDGPMFDPPWTLTGMLLP